MKRLMMAATLFAGLLAAQEGPPTPQPTKEHQWLGQLVGEWTVEGEAVCDPSAPPEKFKGTERVRRVGAFWTTSEYTGELLGQPFTGVFTLGYDAQKRRFVGTWIDSMQAHLWQYQGTLDAAGKTLTLETEGPCCKTGKIMKVRDILEIRSKDERVFTMTVENDGKWVPAMTLHYRRKA